MLGEAEQWSCAFHPFSDLFVIKLLWFSLLLFSNWGFFQLFSLHEIKISCPSSSEDQTLVRSYPSLGRLFCTLSILNVLNFEKAHFINTSVVRPAHPRTSNSGGVQVL